MPMATRPARMPGHQRGALLLEALVAIAVFAVGVLADVAVQAVAFRHVSAAHYRSEAVHLAAAAFGRMWADDPAMLAARYASDAGGTGYAELARLAQQLPGAAQAANAPAVTVDAGPSADSRRVTITLRWQLPGDPSVHRHSATAVIGRNR